MSGCFFDTNVIVYAHDPGDARKQRQARVVMHDALIARTFVISTQVMQEFYNVALRGAWMNAAQASAVLRLLAAYTVVPSTAESVLAAFELQQRHRLSIWDALIVQAALDARCSVLYSEDLQAGKRFEPAAGRAKALEVVNPFEADDAPAVHERRAGYRVRKGR